MRADRQLTLIAAGVAVAIILGWFMLIYRPKGNEISDVNGQIETAQAEEQTLRASLGRLEEIDADRPALEAELQRLQEAVPAQPELGSLLLAAHDMAAEAGVAFVSITPAPPTATEGLDASVVSLGMEAEGRYFSVLEFVNRLEDLDRLVVIDSITLTRVAEEEDGEGSSTAAAGSSGDGASINSLNGNSIDSDGDTAPQASGVPVDDDAIPQPPADPDATLISHTFGVPVTTTTLPLASIASFGDALEGQENQLLTVTLQIQARAFTTAIPFTPGEEEADTTTTTVAGATPTTVAAE